MYEPIIIIIIMHRHGGVAEKERERERENEGIGVSWDIADNEWTWCGVCVPTSTEEG